MATIQKLNLRQLDQSGSLKPAEAEIINFALTEIERKINEMIDKLNTL